MLVPPLVARLIPWDEIRSLQFSAHYRKGVRHQVFLKIYLKDPHTCELATSRFMQKLGNWWYGTPFVFGIEALEGEPEDVLDAITERAPTALLQNSDLHLAN